MTKKLATADDSSCLLFWRYRTDDPESIHKKIIDPDTGPYVFFRRVKTPIQARHAQLMDHSTIPTVFLHGSPHVDNYAKTHTGAGIVDFDRAHDGPYTWDLLCLTIAMSLRNPDAIANFLEPQAIKVLKEGYLQGLLQMRSDYHRFQALENIEPKKWEMNTRAYLKAGKKWAKQLDKCAIDLADPMANEVFQQYLLSRQDTSLLKTHCLEKMAHCHGTFGRPRFLYALIAKDKTEDDILIDIKHTRDYMIPAWSHNQWYRHGFDHQAKRMITASQLYAPSCSLREGFANVNGIDYWGRQIPTLNRKPNKLLDKDEIEDFAYAGSTQLGRGHSLSLAQIGSDDMVKHVHENFDTLIECARQIQQEMLASWRNYCDRYKQA